MIFLDDDPLVIPWEIYKNVKQHPVPHCEGKREKSLLGKSFYPDPQQELMESILGQDPSSIQVS